MTSDGTLSSGRTVMSHGQAGTLVNGSRPAVAVVTESAAPRRPRGRSARFDEEILQGWDLVAVE